MANPKEAPATETSSRRRDGMSWNIYLAEDKFWLRDHFEQKAKNDGRSVSQVVLAVLEEAATPKKR